ncbi:MAG: hypothetical protein JKY94_00565 [Rhodobacteraceae bacterium]|nr:hypothetical protein [Paracoccaceae bacterium]
MDFLKWLLKFSLMLALLFLGIKAEPAQDKPENEDGQKPSSFYRLIE